MKTKYDIAIVLGGGVSPNGSLPVWVERRINKAFELFQSGDIGKILVSGGNPENEAEVMAKYLRDKGIPQRIVMKEKKSRNTVENAAFSKHDYLAPNKWYHPVIITSEFHMPRTKVIFSKIPGPNYSPDFISVSDQGIRTQDFKELLEREKLLSIALNLKST